MAVAVALFHPEACVDAFDLVFGQGEQLEAAEGAGPQLSALLVVHLVAEVRVLVVRPVGRGHGESVRCHDAVGEGRSMGGLNGRHVDEVGRRR